MPTARGHISSGRGVTAAEGARGSADISIETCPTTCSLRATTCCALGPSLRPRCAASRRQGLWKALVRGDWIYRLRPLALLPELKNRETFEVWGGIAGVQSMLPALLNCVGGTRRLMLDRISQVTAANPAQRFGIANKGTIAVGQHADLTLADLNATAEIRAESLLQRHPVSPYVGQTLRGIVRSTYRRGERICSDGRTTAKTPGQFVRPEITRYAESS